MSGTAASARIAVSKPLRGTSRPTDSTRRSGPRSATGPSGLNCSTSTPQGSTVIRCRAAPSRTSSCASSVEVAITAAASRASARSIRIRTGGLVSCRPWKRFFVTPSAWKVCTTGGSARAELPGGGHRGQPGHPEVRVHHVRRVRGEAVGQRPAQVADVRQQLVLRQRLGRAGVEVLDHHAVLGHHPPGQVRRVPPGVHGHLVTGPGQRPGQRLDVHVLPTGVHAADGGERAGVLGHHRDPHRVTSLSSRSQSSVKRPSPYRASAACRATRPASAAASRSTR